MTPCWLWFACASIAVEACDKICAAASLVDSAEKSASSIRDLASVKLVAVDLMQTRRYSRCPKSNVYGMRLNLIFGTDRLIEDGVA